MPKNNSDRRRQQRTRYRTSAAAARARQAQRRRRGIISGSVAVVIIVALVILLFSPLTSSGNKSATTTSTAASTTSVAPTSAPMKSAAGKPCVVTNGALPKGAPAVPVETGPPPTKLVIKDLKVGTGAVVKAGQTVNVDYIGVACSTGTIFDSSYQSGLPTPIDLNSVIPGWQQGIPGMKVGGERLLGIPSGLAYGTAGRAPTIAPDEALWFVVVVHSAK